MSRSPPCCAILPSRESTSGDLAEDTIARAIALRLASVSWRVVAALGVMRRPPFSGRNVAERVCSVPTCQSLDRLQVRVSLQSDETDQTRTSERRGAARMPNRRDASDSSKGASDTESFDGVSESDLEIAETQAEPSESPVLPDPDALEPNSADEKQVRAPMGSRSQASSPKRAMPPKTKTRRAKSVPSKVAARVNAIESLLQEAAASGRNGVPPDSAALDDEKLVQLSTSCPLARASVIALIVLLLACIFSATVCWTTVAPRAPTLTPPSSIVKRPSSAPFVHLGSFALWPEVVTDLLAEPTSPARSGRLAPAKWTAPSKPKYHRSLELRASCARPPQVRAARSAMAHVWGTQWRRSGCEKHTRAGASSSRGKPCGRPQEERGLPRETYRCDASGSCCSPASMICAAREVGRHATQNLASTVRLALSSAVSASRRLVKHVIALLSRFSAWARGTIVRAVSTRGA